jgi:hypothetical protein
MPGIGVPLAVLSDFEELNLYIVEYIVEQTVGKILEGRKPEETLQRELDLFGGVEPILPPLQDNIKCGNSLIASDFSLVPDDLVRVHAFD